MVLNEYDLSARFLLWVMGFLYGVRIGEADISPS